MSYKATVFALGPIIPHPNADRVRLTSIFGNQVVVGMNCKEGDLGVYFPSDGVLSHEYCRANNLYRERQLNSDPNETPGMFDTNKRVRAQKFRGQKSDGYWAPIDSLSKMLGPGDRWLPGFKMEHGYEFDTIDGRIVCEKWLNEATRNALKASLGKKNPKSARTSVMFKEHFDTPHFGRSVTKIGFGDTLVVTEKIHGTSARIGHVLVDRKLNWFERLLERFGVRIERQEWAYLNGSRRVVLGESKNSAAFHDPTIRDMAFDIFNGKLRKGETVYCEIFGYEPSGKPIMEGVTIRKKDHPTLHDTYGDTMQYSYGCEPGQCKVQVYRMTMTSPDGHSIDLTWPEVKMRCLEIGVAHVPELETIDCLEVGVQSMNQEVPFETILMDRIEKLSGGPSTLDSRHLREGVCVRIDRIAENVTMKHKSFEFKLVEGMIKDLGGVDAEESN